VAVQLARPAVVDGAAQRVEVRGRRVPFAEIGGLDVAEMRVGSTLATSLVLQTARGPLRLVNGQSAAHREALERVAARVRARLAVPMGALAPVPVSPRAFTAVYLVALGVIWAGSAAWLAPDLFFATLDGRVGVHLWPFGLWLIALGALEASGVEAFRVLRGRWTLRRGALFAVWMGSYLVLCGRVLG